MPLFQENEVGFGPDAGLEQSALGIRCHLGHNTKLPRTPNIAPLLMVVMMMAMIIAVMMIVMWWWWWRVQSMVVKVMLLIPSGSKWCPHFSECRSMFTLYSVSITFILSEYYSLCYLMVTIGCCGVKGSPTVFVLNIHQLKMKIYQLKMKIH